MSSYEFVTISTDMRGFLFRVGLLVVVIVLQLYHPRNFVGIFERNSPRNER